jgi:hypothetical protein
MAQVLDLIGASIIAALLLVTALSLNASVMETTMLHNQNLYIQEEATFITELIDRDLSNVGYGDTTKSSIKAATAKSLVFRTDADHNNKVDTIGYFFTTGSQVGTILTAWQCQSRSLGVPPNDSILFRFSTTTEGGGRGMPMLITTKAKKFSFTYLSRSGTSMGSTPAPIDSVRYIRIALELNNATQPADSNDALVHWEKTYRPKNLK